MNILVTGASGFLGNIIVNKLKNDHQIILITSKKEHFNENEYIIYDYNDLYDKNINFKEIDYIIHCGFARSSEPSNLVDSINFTTELVKQSSISKIKGFIHISSQSVYDAQRKEPATEDDVPKPNSKYGLAKYCCERIVESNLEKHNIQFTNLRLGSLTGENFTYRLTHRIVKSLINDGSININGKGNQVISYLEGRVAADMIISLIDYDQWSTIYNIGSSNSYTLSEIANTIISVGSKYGYKGLLNIEDTDDYVNLSLDTTKFNHKTNISHWWDLESNIIEIFNLYKGEKSNNES